MKKIFYLFFLSIFLSCQSNTNNKTIEEKTVITKEQERQIVKEYLELYTKLMNFKDTKDFKKLGFGEASPFNSWKQDVEKYKEEPMKTVLLSRNLLPDELLQLGTEYALNNGKENDVTKFFNEVYKNAVETYMESSNLNNLNQLAPLSNKDNIIGKWKLTGGLTMDITIFERGGKYYSHENNKDVELTKKGNKYFLKNSKVGEYYIIKNDQLRLGDNQGDFTDEMGIKVSKIK